MSDWSPKYCKSSIKPWRSEGGGLIFFETHLRVVGGGGALSGLSESSEVDD